MVPSFLKFSHKNILNSCSDVTFCDSDSVPVTLSERNGTLLGGNIVAISGISLDEDDEITCKFGAGTADGVYINADQAVCIAPSAEVESVVEFVITVARGGLNLKGRALYRYGK